MGLQEDIDALRDLIPYAGAEPVYWRAPLKVALYIDLERHLRSMLGHASTLEWVLLSAKARDGSLPGMETHLALRDLFCRDGLFYKEAEAMLNACEELARAVTDDSVHDGGSGLLVKEQLEA